MMRVVTAAVLACAAACTSGHPSAAKPTRTSTTSTSTTSTSTSTTITPPGTCPAPAARAGDGLDAGMPSYVVNVDYRPGENAVVGDVTVRFTPDMDTDHLLFRLWPNGPRPGAAGAHIDTGAVTVDGRAAAARLQDPTTLVVTLGAPTRRTVEASLPWRLTLPRPVDDRVSRSGDTIRLGSFIPMLPWEPGVGWDDEPPTAGFAEASTGPPARFDVAVTVPSGLDVLATGERSNDGHYHATGVPDFGMSVGHFAEATAVVMVPQPVTITVGVDRVVAESPQLYLDKIARVLAQQSQRFGPYPWPTYTMAVTPALVGGIEYPMHVMQGPKSFGRTTSHELSHQWFYADVVNDQGRDPWLDEGLASYAEARAEGTEAAFRARVIPAQGVGHAGEPMAYFAGRPSIYYATVYAQPVKALLTLGPPALVDCVLRLYVDQNAHRIARPVDLFRALTVVFPDAVAKLAPYGLHP